MESFKFLQNAKKTFPITGLKHCKWKSYYVIILAILAIFVTSCEDPAPMDYIQDCYIEGYLLAGEPITGFRVTYTQPLDQPFSVKNGNITDASVKIICYKGYTDSIEQVLTLAYKQDDSLAQKSGFYSDPGFKIKPLTKYRLEININDNEKTRITGLTYVPDSISWIKPPKDTINYPKDTNALPVDNNLEIEWRRVNSTMAYILCTDCLDTVGYGKYLSPPTAERNRPVYNFITNQMSKRQDTARPSYYKEKTWVGMIRNTHTQTVWMAFKWFGPHLVSVYAPDFNMLRWFFASMYGGQNYGITNSVKSENGKRAFGVFGSASVVRHYLFMKKNQP